MKIEGIHIQRVHGYGKTDKILPRTINAKFSSYIDISFKDISIKEQYLKRLQIFGKRNGKH